MRFTLCWLAKPRAGCDMESSISQVDTASSLVHSVHRHVHKHKAEMWQLPQLLSGSSKQAQRRRADTANNLPVQNLLIKNLLQREQIISFQSLVPEDQATEVGTLMFQNSDLSLRAADPDCTRSGPDI